MFESGLGCGGRSCFFVQKSLVDVEVLKQENILTAFSDKTNTFCFWILKIVTDISRQFEKGICLTFQSGRHILENCFRIIFCNVNARIGIVSS